MRHLLLIPLALCCAALCMGCDSLARRNASPAATDSSSLDSAAVRLDSADYEGNDSATAEVRLHMEYLTGTSPLARSVRSYVREQLEETRRELLRNLESTLDGQEQADNARDWEGDADDIGGMTAFYGRQMYDYLRKESQILNANVGTEYAMRMVDDKELRQFCAAEKFVTFKGSGYFYEGGAHGYSYMWTATFVRKTGKLLTQVLDTTRIQALQPLILQGICDYLNSWNEGEGYGEAEPITPSTVKSYLLLDATLGMAKAPMDTLSAAATDGLVPLPAVTPALTEDGLLFTYNPYEIAPYAAGIITFTIPYQPLRPYLTEEARQLVGLGKE